MATISITQQSAEAPARRLPKVSVLMPAFNEEANLRQSVSRAREQLEKIGVAYEIVVVDDGSTDGTKTLACVLNHDGRLRVVGYPQNQGKGFAVKYGSNYATGDVLVLMDSDADITPDLIGEYIEVLRDNDIAIASKRHPASNVSSPFLRKFLSNSFHCLVMLLTGVRVSDTQSGFKAFRREALTKIMNLVSVKEYAFDVEILTVAKLLHLRIGELPIRIELGSLFSVRQVIRMLIDLMGITYRLRVIHWYQKNLHNDHAFYNPIIKW